MTGYSFTVAATGGLTSYNQGARFQYSSVISNVGDAYSVEAREFRCPVDGIYLFSGSTMTGESQGARTALMKHNGASIAGFYSHGSNYDYGSNTVVVECKMDDRVWVECGAGPGCYLYQTGNYITFSGVFHRKVVGKASLDEVYQLVTSVQQEVKAGNTQLSRLEEEVAGLKGENARLLHVEEEVAGLRAENAHLEEEVVGLKEEVVGLKADNSRLHEELAKGHSKYGNEMTGYSFTVAAAGEETSYSQGQRFLYSNVISNVGGAYSVEAREFRCPVDGIYLFAGSTMSGTSDAARDAVVRLNGTHIATYFAHSSNYDFGSNTVVVECKQDDRVWVECGHGFGCRLNQGSRYVTFSGVLLQA